MPYIKTTQKVDHKTAQHIYFERHGFRHHCRNHSQRRWLLSLEESDSEFGAGEEPRMRVGPVGTFLGQERYFYGQA